MLEHIAGAAALCAADQFAATHGDLVGAGGLEAGGRDIRPSAHMPGGAVHLFYETRIPDDVPKIIKGASAALSQGGFRVSVVDNKQPPVVGIIGRR